MISDLKKKKTGKRRRGVFVSEQTPGSVGGFYSAESLFGEDSKKMSAI